HRRVLHSLPTRRSSHLRFRFQWILHDHRAFYNFAFAHFVTRRVNLADLVAERILAAWRAFFYRDRAVRINCYRTAVNRYIRNRDILARYNWLAAQLIVVRYLRYILRLGRIIWGLHVRLRFQWVLYNN